LYGTRKLFGIIFKSHRYESRSGARLLTNVLESGKYLGTPHRQMVGAWGAYEESISLLSIALSNDDPFPQTYAGLGDEWSLDSQSEQYRSQPQSDASLVTADLLAPPPHASHHSRPSLSASTIVTPTPRRRGSNFSNNSTRSHSQSPSNLPENELRASLALSIQGVLSLATALAELAPNPCISVLVEDLTVAFRTGEKSRVNKEQWKLLQGRCMMVSRIAGAQVANYGGQHYSELQHASEALRHVTQMQWIGEFDTVQRQELTRLEQLRTMMDGMEFTLYPASRTQGTRRQWELLRERCVMVRCMIDAHVTGDDGEHCNELQHVSELLCDAINHMSERALYCGQCKMVLMFARHQEISEEIAAHFCTLNSCLNLFLAIRQENGSQPI
ncbi:hypothetical protein FRC09_004061, partial [Ceratobasidium sp. 395]